MTIGTAAAIIGGSLIAGGGSLLAGNAQASGAERAGELSATATQQAVAEQRRQFDQTRTDLAPYRQTGANALSQYAALFGINDNDPANNPEFLDEQYQTGSQSVWQPGISGGGNFNPVVEGPPSGPGGAAPSPGQWVDQPTYGTRQVANEAYDPNGAFLSNEEQQAARDRFLETPGYQFRFDEGMRALDLSAASRGRLNSGGYGRELTRYGQGVAADEFNNYANRLAGIAAGGQGAAVTTGQLGAQSAGNVGNLLLSGAAQQGNAAFQAGTARASGFAGAANAGTGAANNFLTFNALQQGQLQGNVGSLYGNF